MRQAWTESERFSFLDYGNRRKNIEEFNTANRWVKRGISILPLKYHLGYFGTSHALVSIFHGDGSVAITVGGIEMGQGLNTKVAQTAAAILGIPLEKISIKPSNSLTAPNAVVTGGSSGSEICCYVSVISKFECQLCHLFFSRLFKKHANPSSTD
jgi:xanthine dehydrogenase/oxidase